MTTQGPLSPGTIVDDSSFGAGAWSNPGNAAGSNDVYAQAVLSAGARPSHYLKATNFGFSIPTGATITGILVEIEKKLQGSGTIQDERCRIVKADGSIGSTEKAIAGTFSTEQYYSYGSGSDLWGESWTPANINDADFGVAYSVQRVTGTSPTCSVDHIRITITYTAGQTISVGQTVETETPQIVEPSHKASVAQVVETESPQAVTSGGQVVAVGQVVETEIAAAVTPRKTAHIAQAVELETPQVVTPHVTPGVLTKAFRATLNTSGTPQTISWSPGGSWPVDATPKAVIVAVTRIVNAQLDGDGWTPNQSMIMGLGAATAPTARGSALSTVRGGSFSPETHRSLTDDHLISIANHNANSIDAAINLNSFITNGLMLDIEDFPAGAYEIIGTAFAGDQITHAELISWAEDGGVQDVPVPHDDPKLAIHIWNGANAMDAINSKGAFFLGAQNDQGEEIAFDATAIGSADKGRLMRGDRCLAIDNFSGLTFSAHSGGMLTSAFRVIWDDNPPPSDKQLVFSLVFWGPFRSKIFIRTKPDDAGPAVDDVPLDFTGLFAFLVTGQKTSGTSSVDDNRGGIGIVDGTDQYAYSWTDEDGANPASVYANLRSGVALTKADNNTPAIEATDTASFVGTLLRNTWNPNDAVELEYGGIVIGLEASGVVAVGITLETETPQTVEPRKTAPVGQITELETPGAVKAGQRVPVGAVTETETLGAITPRRAATVAQAIELEAAQSVIARKIIDVSAVAELEAAQTVEPGHVADVAQALELEAPQTVSRPDNTIVPVGQTSELETVAQVTPSKIEHVAQAIELEVPQLVEPGREVPVGQASELETPQNVTPAKRAPVLQVLEVEIPQLVEAAHRLAVQQVLELEIVQAVEITRTIDVAQVLELELAQLVTPLGGLFRDLTLKAGPPVHRWRNATGRGSNRWTIGGPTG